MNSSSLDSVLAACSSELTRCRDMVGIVDALAGSMPAMGLDDFLRAALAAAVSAWDAFIHSLVVEGIRLQLRGYGPDNISKNVPLPISRLRAFQEDPRALLDEVVERISEDLYRKTFQDPEDVADALKMLHGGPLWLTLADGDGAVANRLKLELKTVVQRRNVIVHQADIDPVAGQKNAIDSEMVLQAINTIENNASRVCDFIRVHY